MNTKDGGPAFPLPLSADPHLEQAPYIEPSDKGMTLRDYFASKALAAIPHMGCGADLDNDDMAEAAYQLADAMLAAREAKQ